MKTDLINIDNLSKGINNFNNSNAFFNVVNKLQSFLVEMEKTEQIKLQANALTHNSDNQVKIIAKQFDSKDLETKAQIRLNDQNHEQTMAHLTNNHNENQTILNMVDKLISMDKTDEAVNIILAILDKRKNA